MNTAVLITIVTISVIILIIAGTTTLSLGIEKNNDILIGVGSGCIGVAGVVVLGGIIMLCYHSYSIPTNSKDSTPIIERQPAYLTDE
jgi:uncharacterized membrane protein YadS